MKDIAVVEKTKTSPVVRIISKDDIYFRSPCPRASICCIHTRHCDANGTRHDECGEWDMCVEKHNEQLAGLYGARCISCGWVRLHNGDWVEPVDGAIKHVPDKEGVYHWFYGNDIPLGNLGSVICPKCSPKKDGI